MNLKLFGRRKAPLNNQAQSLSPPVGSDRQISQPLQAEFPPSGEEAKDSLILRLEEVVKEYHTGAGAFRALDEISLDIHRGEFIGVVGKSGAGKTTLLNVISGVSGITAGEVRYYEAERTDLPQAPQNGASPGLSIHALNEDDLAVWRGRKLGIVYQSFELMPQLNLLKNIMLPQDFSGLYQPGISAERARELLEIVELSEHAYKLPAHISGGQKQRVAIARALVNDPPIILADEPTGNLDTVTAERIFQIFEKLVQQGKTVVFVTHDNNLAARFSRLVYISDGKLVSRYGGDETAPAQADAGAIEPGIEPSTNGANGSSLGSLAPLTTSTANGSNKNGAGKSTPERAKTAPAIQLQEVVKTYRNAAGEFTALKGISLEMQYGQFISIVGKSGSGKSTLLNMLTGIDHPTSGSVIIGGEDIYQLSESQRALWRGRNIGIVFQFFQLLPTLTLLENTMLPMDYCDVHALSERPQRAMDLLAKVGLEEQAHKLPSAVSSGQQQSAAIARALATDPPILVADEPTGNLDSRSADKVMNLFAELATQGKTILIVTHDPSFTSRTDQTIILSDGEIIDETVARALPLLNHPQMLEATHKAQKKTVSPGTTILHQGDHVEHLYLVSEGEIEVVIKNPGCPEISLARLGKGQFFGEIELLHKNHSIASIRAAGEAPVELALLPKADFEQLLQESPRMEQVLVQVAQERQAENQAMKGGC